MVGMFREDLRIVANEHHATVLDQYKDEVGKGVSNSIIYYHGLPGRMGHEIPTVYTHESTTTVEVLPLDTVAAIDTIGLDQNVSVLNFASYKNPGGMFLNGSRAQEEALCHASVLYEVLNEFENTYYAQNRKMLNYGMYEDIGIYSKSLLFDKPRKRKVDVMTCAAPNMNALQWHKEQIRLNAPAVYNRCAFVLDCMYKHDPDVIILGAFGCGVFKQDPALVARAFHEALNTRYFKRVIFAIPDESSKNYKAFQSEFLS